MAVTGDSHREAEADRAALAGDFQTAERLFAAAVADAPRNAGLWLKLASTRHALGRLPDALSAVSGALAVNPLAFLPLMMKATLLEQMGKDDAADEIYGAVLFHAPPPERMSAGMTAQMAHARQRHAAYVERRAAILDQALEAVTLPRNEAEARAIARFRTNTLRTTRGWRQEPTHFDFPGLPEIEFFGRETFPFLETLEAATDTIRAEFEALIASQQAELVPYVQYPDDAPGQMPHLNKSRDWTAIHLLTLGERVEANARLCPQTLALFDTLDTPRIPGRSPNLMFSLLAPHTRIPPHHGVTNTRLVLHLPLIVPDKCGFRCGAETRTWVPGQAFVFDDTIEHEAWNDSDQPRVVLIGELWRPELSAAERAAVSAIIAAGSSVGAL